MASVTFNFNKQSGENVIITLSGNGSTYIFGPANGSQTVNLVSGGAYSISASRSGLGSPSNSNSISVFQAETQGWVSAGSQGSNSYAIGQLCLSRYNIGTTILGFAYNTKRFPSSPNTCTGPGYLQIGNTRYTIGGVDQAIATLSDSFASTFSPLYRYDYVTNPGWNSTLSASGGFFTGSTFYAPYDPPVVTFTANPNPNYNTNGTPTNSVTFTWTATNTTGWGTTTASINQSIGSVTPVANGSRSVNTGLQSIAGSSSTSPASKTYTITVSNPSYTTSQSVTVQVYNDNTPSNISVASTATGGGSVKPLSNLEPNTVYYVLINYTKSSIDMPTKLTPATSGVNVSTDAVTWTSGTRLVPLNGNIYVQFTSAGFNTSTVVGGTNSLGQAIGQTNTKTISITFGTQSYSFNVTTRAPVLQETFDAEISQGFYPYPDIDTVAPEPTLENYGYANRVTMNDIEVPVEIKSNNPDTQIKINNGSWVNVRSI